MSGAITILLAAAVSPAGLLDAAITVDGADQRQGEEISMTQQQDSHGRITVIRSGTRHHDQVIQTGADQSIVLEQHGRDHALASVQTGTGEQLVVRQSGAGARADINQAGLRNETVVEQASGANHASVTQTGNGNRVVIVQGRPHGAEQP